MEEYKKRICAGISMVLEKSEKIGREKREWSLEEVGEMSDIVKDMSEALKDIAKTHYYLSEHSIEKF
jgi:hypothetical protein